MVPKASRSLPIPSRAVDTLVYRQQRARVSRRIQQIGDAHIRIIASDLVPRIPEHAINISRPGREFVDILHELPHPFPIRCASRPPGRNFRHPEWLIVPFRAVLHDVVDDCRGLRGVLVDVVRGEEIFAVTRGEEFVQERVVRVRGDGRDEFRGLPLRCVDEWLDGCSGVSSVHRRRHAHVRVIGFVEGEHPYWWGGRVNHIYCGGTSLAKHHGYEARGRVWRGGSAGDVRAECEPVFSRTDGVEHSWVHAAVEGYSFHKGWTAGSASRCTSWGVGAVICDVKLAAGAAWW